MHLGPGAFFRAFNAVYTDEAMQDGAGDWGIVAISLRSPTARDQLAPQDNVYTSVTLAADGWQPRVMGSIVHSLVAPEDPKRAIDAMADPAIRIVSLTITEKGYCLGAGGGALDLTHPDIAHDLAQPDHPKSAIGLMVAALDARRAAGCRPFTILSCDNLPANGTLARAATLEFARQRDGELAEWIAREGAFPSTMVDRITPATTAADIEKLAALTGYADAACVFHEGFRQWVIEDEFTEARPAWDKAGATFVRCVAAHETMKLRCLNGTHSTLAYLGYLAGYETIAQTVADPAFETLCSRLWHDEIIPTLQTPDGEDLPAYCAALMARYQNPQIRHRTWQIAMDGSQKLPQRLLGTMADCLATGRDPRGLALGVAAWMRYVGGQDENGQPIDVRDPLADALRQASDTAPDSAGKVAALLRFDGIFPQALAANAGFGALVTRSYEQLVTRGARGAVADFVNS